jgi:peptidoglycan L-alanyl-D-glutamate endopeptidase CwlK
MFENGLRNILLPITGHPRLEKMTFDERSEINLATLHPTMQKVMRAFLGAAKGIAAKTGYDVKIISGTRSYLEQDALYAKGRTSTGKKVTNAAAGHSNHNFGIAADIGIFKGREYLGEHPLYRELGVLGKSLGMEWGGDWKFVDEPHYQLRPHWAIGMTERDMLANLRNRVSKKIDILA